jgi:signal transduction histidine kinase
VAVNGSGAPLVAPSTPHDVASELARHAARLARENEALQDFIALVAHDLRAELVSAMRTEAPQENLTRALELVGAILEAARIDLATGSYAQIEPCLELALADLGEISANVAVNVEGRVPLPAAALRILLRNILANAVAACARRIRVSAIVLGHTHAIVVDDDGVGGSGDGYERGAGLGLALCRRLISRFGGALELRPGPLGGMRATIVLAGRGQ